MTKINNFDDFNIPDDLIPPRLSSKGTNDKDEGLVTEGLYDNQMKHTNKGFKKSRPPDKNETPAVTVRLTFNKDEYKSLVAMALLETEKTGKRCSITQLIYQQTDKLIKKGNTNV